MGGLGFIKQPCRIWRSRIEKSQDAFDAFGRCVKRNGHDIEPDRRAQNGDPDIGRREQPRAVRPNQMRADAGFLTGIGDIDAEQLRIPGRPNQMD